MSKLVRMLKYQICAYSILLITQPILIKLYIYMRVFRKLAATSKAPQRIVLVLVKVILQKLGQKLTKYGRGCPRAPVDTRSPEPPQEFGRGP